MDTGSLGTDIYVTNLRMYDITDLSSVGIEKSGVANLTSYIEGSSPIVSMSFSKEITANNIIEY